MSNMAFSSQKDVDKEQTNNNFSKSARLHATNDYILSEFLDFPQFSPDAHFDSLYSLRTESDYWGSANQLSKVTECKSSMHKIDNASVGSLMKLCFADLHPEVNTNRDSISLYEMSLSDNLNAWAVNTGTFDAFDYIEESGASVNMDNKFVESVFQCGQYNSSSQCSGYIGSHADDIDDRTACQSDSELGNCYAEQLPSINCCSWPPDNIQMDLTSSQNHRFETVADQEESIHAENGFIWSDWSLITPECEKCLPREQSYGTAEFSASTVMTVPGANVDACTGSQNSEYVTHLASSSTSLIEVLDSKIKNFTQTNINELQPDTRSVGTTQQVQKYAQPVHQKEDTKSASRNITEMPFVSMIQQRELPCSAHMTVDVQSASNPCYEVRNTQLASSRMNAVTEHECAAQVEQFPSESYFSHPQANRENNIHTITSPSKVYMKVGKRGRYVTLPAKRVNEMMVRDLLCVSGNKEEMSIRDVTQDYRNNIRRILEQKIKRLNNVKC